MSTRRLPPSPHWRLYVILDPEHLFAGQDVYDVARAALEGGARLFQLRDKRSDLRTLIASAKRLQALCDDYDATFLVNDRIDVALAAGADGVHLGPEDMPVADARRIAPELLIGASASGPEVARALIAQGADYLGVGALFDARKSKPDASAPKGVAVIEQVREALGPQIPIVGIGGVTLENARSVCEAGADGVAVIRAVSGESDAHAAVKALLAQLPRGDRP